MKNEITFSLDGFPDSGAGASKGKHSMLKTGSEISAETVPFLDTLAHSQVADHLKFSNSRALPVFMRGAIVRIASMKLIATGLLAMLVAIFSTSPKVSFSCSLAAAVNFVAVIHYLLIWMAREQSFPQAYLHLALGRSKDGTAHVGAEKDEEHEEDKITTQEYIVDSLRYSDWAVSPKPSSPAPCPTPLPTLTPSSRVPC